VSRALSDAGADDRPDATGERRGGATPLRALVDRLPRSQTECLPFRRAYHRLRRLRDELAGGIYRNNKQRRRRKKREITDNHSSDIVEAG